MTTQVLPSFTEVYETYYSRIYRRVYYLVNHHELAQDLTHDTFYKAYRAFPSLKPTHNLYSWLYRIATNVALDELRHRKVISWQSLAPLEQVLEDSESETALGAVLLSEEISTILNALPQEYRTMLLLRAQGYTNAELAQRFGKSEAVMKAAVWRAKRSFQQRYHALQHREGKREHL